MRRGQGIQRPVAILPIKVNVACVMSSHTYSPFDLARAFANAVRLASRKVAITKSRDGIAVDGVSPFMALLSFCGIDTPSLADQGEQRRLSLFNIPTGQFLECVRRLDKGHPTVVC
jgi:hypothetical protein